MKVAVFGASGNIGQRITAELVSRGHSVLAVVRDTSKIAPQPNVRGVKGDATNPASIADVIRGQQAVVSSIQAKPGENVTSVIDAAHALLKGLAQTKVRRLIVVGGAASLSIGPGMILLDSPNFPPEWKPIAQAHADALKVYQKNKNLDWTYFSPAALIEPGQRTENYRLGSDSLVMDKQGNSRISMEDFAVALVNELEHPLHIRKRFTIGY